MTYKATILDTTKYTASIIPEFKKVESKKNAGNRSVLWVENTLISIIQIKNTRSLITANPVANTKSATITEIIIQNSDVPTTNSIVFSFNASDLNSNFELIRYHGLNAEIVDVTVTNNIGKQVEVDTEMSGLNSIKLTFNRIAITGTWKVLIEK